MLSTYGVDTILCRHAHAAAGSLTPCRDFLQVHLARANAHAVTDSPYTRVAPVSVGKLQGFYQVSCWFLEPVSTCINRFGPLLNSKDSVTSEDSYSHRAYLAVWLGFATAKVRKVLSQLRAFVAPH